MALVRRCLRGVKGGGKKSISALHVQAEPASATDGGTVPPYARPEGNSYIERGR